MKIILSSRRHHYLARDSIFLITVALVVGMVSCGKPAPSYNLTIASTAEGSVTTPDEGMFIYDGVMVVDLLATLDAGYHFVNWTSDVSTIVNVNDAATNITMNDY